MSIVDHPTSIVTFLVTICPYDLLKSKSIYELVVEFQQYLNVVSLNITHAHSIQVVPLMKELGYFTP